MGNNSFQIFEYQNLNQMLLGIPTNTIHLYLPELDSNYQYQNLTILNQGNPSFEMVEWTGSMYTSKIDIIFEYMLDDYSIRLAKGSYRFTGFEQGQIRFKWTLHPMD